MGTQLQSSLHSLSNNSQFLLACIGFIQEETMELSFNVPCKQTSNEKERSRMMILRRTHSRTLVV